METVTKAFYKSKVFWFNILAVVVVIASQFGFSEFTLDAEVAAGVVAIINLVLRLWATRTALTT